MHESLCVGYIFTQICFTRFWVLHLKVNFPSLQSNRLFFVLVHELELLKVTVGAAVTDYVIGFVLDQPLQHRAASSKQVMKRKICPTTHQSIHRTKPWQRYIGSEGTVLGPDSLLSLCTNSVASRASEHLPVTSIVFKVSRRGKNDISFVIP